MTPCIAAKNRVTFHAPRRAAFHQLSTLSTRQLLEKLGRLTPLVDAQVAAVAITNGIPLITANLADFAPFKGLGLQSWVSAQ